MDRGKLGQEFKPAEMAGWQPSKVRLAALLNEPVRSIKSLGNATLMKRSLTLSGFCCVLVVGLLTSCGRKAGSVEMAAQIWGPTMYSGVPAEPGQRPSPGFDLGAFAMGLRYREPEFAVWIGGSGSCEFSGGDEVVNPEPPQRVCKFQGSLLGVALECRTTGGKSGTIKLGTETFQLERGALFLVSTSGAKPQVRQMALTKLNLKPEGRLLSGNGAVEYLRELAKTDPEIQAFWHSVSTVN